MLLIILKFSRERNSDCRLIYSFEGETQFVYKTYQSDFIGGGTLVLHLLLLIDFSRAFMS